MKIKMESPYHKILTEFFFNVILTLTTFLMIYFELTKKLHDITLGRDAYIFLTGVIFYSLGRLRATVLTMPL